MASVVRLNKNRKEDMHTIKQNLTLKTISCSCGFRLMRTGNWLKQILDHAAKH